MAFPGFPVPGASTVSPTLCPQVLLGHCDEDEMCTISVSKTGGPLLVRGQGKRG